MTRIRKLGRITARSTGPAPAPRSSSRPPKNSHTSFHMGHSKVKRPGGIGKRARTSMTPGAAAAHELYISRPEAVEHVNGEPAIISTISADIGERQAFWRAVEENERAGGLVQNRIIGEMPHELEAADRREALQDFLDHFACRDIRFTAVLHKPGPESDERNFHAHVDYYERPCDQLAGGHWDFELPGKKRNKVREVATRDWLPEVRRWWCDAMNRALERAGKTRRYLSGKLSTNPRQRHEGQWAKGKRKGDEAFEKRIADLPEEVRHAIRTERATKSAERRMARSAKLEGELKGSERTEGQERLLQNVRARIAVDAKTIQSVKRVKAEPIVTPRIAINLPEKPKKKPATPGKSGPILSL